MKHIRGSVTLGTLLGLTAVVAVVTLWPTGPVAKWWQGRAERAQVRAEARASKAEARVDAQTAAVLGGVQESIYKAGESVGLIPKGRAQELTAGFVADARAGIDQVQGTPTAGDSAAWRQLVADLMSEVATVRADAERRDRAADAELAKRSDALAMARAELAVREDELQKATAQRIEADSRLVALGQRYAAIRAGLVAVALLAVALGGLWIFKRAQLFALRKAAGVAISDGDASGIGAAVRALFDGPLPPAEQAAIRAEVAKATADRLSTK